MAQAIGGQAVLEGVMMRGPRNWAVAVRKPDGQIAQVNRPDLPARGAPLDAAPSGRARRRRTRRVARDRLPRTVRLRELRGVAEAEEGDDEAFELGGWTLFFSFAVAIGFVIAAFKVGPALIADSLPIRNGTYFVLVEGARLDPSAVTLFVGYLAPPR